MPGSSRAEGAFSLRCGSFLSWTDFYQKCHTLQIALPPRHEVRWRSELHCLTDPHEAHDVIRCRSLKNLWEFVKYSQNADLTLFGVIFRCVTLGKVDCHQTDHSDFHIESDVLSFRCWGRSWLRAARWNVHLVTKNCNSSTQWKSFLHLIFEGGIYP